MFFAFLIISGFQKVDPDMLTKVYVYGILLQGVLCVLTVFILHKYYAKPWEQRRLDDKKLSFHTYTMAIRELKKDVLTPEFLNKMEVLDTQVSNSSDYEEVCELHKHILKVRDGLKAQTALLNV